MKTIELIDKYEVHQSEEGDYNPPSYIWRDNTGELIRCKDCKFYGQNGYFYGCPYAVLIMMPNNYCSNAVRKEE